VLYDGWPHGIVSTVFLPIRGSRNKQQSEMSRLNKSVDWNDRTSFDGSSLLMGENCV
jgi:hypothetical protein